MQFALLIYESPEAFASRKKHEIGAYTGAWRSYYKALVDAGVYVGCDPLQVPVVVGVWIGGICFNRLIPARSPDSAL